MRIIIDSNKEEYISREIIQILDGIEKINLPSNNKTAKEGNMGSIDQKIPIDLGDCIVDSELTLSQPDAYGNIIHKQKCFGKICYKLNEHYYKKFLKLIETLHSDKLIQRTISYEFIEQEGFNWLMDSAKSKQITQNFIDFITEKLNDSIEERVFFIPILYLDIDAPFKIGNVDIGYFTKDYFDSVEKTARLNKNEEFDENFKYFRDKHLGLVFASCRVKAEQNRAEEIAIQKCSVALDILKTCSTTTILPSRPLSFDLDRRVNQNAQNEIISARSENVFDKLRTTSSRNPNHYRIDKNEWKRLIQMNLLFFGKFLEENANSDNELSKLIFQSFERYSLALSNKDLHQRIVQLFTILESLLLINNHSNINENVCKYCSKIVFKDKEKRKVAISLLKATYQIRSAFIHHAKRKKISLTELGKLQTIVVDLLSKLIILSKKHTTKESILNEIDDAILGAY